MPADTAPPVVPAAVHGAVRGAAGLPGNIDTPTAPGAGRRTVRRGRAGPAAPGHRLDLDRLRRPGPRPRRRTGGGHDDEHQPPRRGAVAANLVQRGATAVEIQTHAPDGLRRLLGDEPYGMRLLDPGDTLSLGLTLFFRWSRPALSELALERVRKENSEPQSTHLATATSRVPRDQSGGLLRREPEDSLYSSTARCRQAGAVAPRQKPAPRPPIPGPLLRTGSPDPNRAGRPGTAPPNRLRRG